MPPKNKAANQPVVALGGVALRVSFFFLRTTDPMTLTNRRSRYLTNTEAACLAETDFVTPLNLLVFQSIQLTLKIDLRGFHQF